MKNVSIKPLVVVALVCFAFFFMMTTRVQSEITSWRGHCYRYWEVNDSADDLAGCDYTPNAGDDCNVTVHCRREGRDWNGFERICTMLFWGTKKPIITIPNLFNLTRTPRIDFKIITYRNDGSELQNRNFQNKGINYYLERVPRIITRRDYTRIKGFKIIVRYSACRDIDQ